MSQSMHKVCQKIVTLGMPFDNKIPRFDMVFDMSHGMYSDMAGGMKCDMYGDIRRVF